MDIFQDGATDFFSYVIHPLSDNVSFTFSTEYYKSIHIRYRNLSEKTSRILKLFVIITSFASHKSLQVTVCN